MLRSVYGKALVLTICILLIAALAAAGCKKGGDEPSPTEVVSDTTTEEPVLTAEPSPEPTAEPLPEFAGNEMPGRDGIVAAMDTGTYGVATDGSVRFMGRSVSGQHYISDWADVVRLAVSGNTTAALVSDGTVLLTGEHAEDFAEAANWTDIVDIALGDAHMIGLRSDGTVCAVGDDSHGQLKVQNWQRVTHIYACADFTVGITDEYGEGVLDTAHRTNYGLGEGERVVAAAPARDHIALLTDSGRVLTFTYSANTAQKEDSDDSSGRGADLGWTNIVKIAAAEGATYGVDANGRFFGSSEIITSMDTEFGVDNDPFANVYGVSAAAGHFALLYGDGTAAGFGSNDDLQCELGVWRLLPYVTEDGYLLGYAEGDIVNGEEYRTGLELNFSDPITGETAQVTAVLLGDLNGDGKIDAADVDLMSAYRSGTSALEGAFLRAANIIDDGGAPGAVDFVDQDALKAHVAGSRMIDQYAKKDMYTDALANAKRRNGDSLGYITIEGTNISYPIMYGSDWYYHTRGIDKNYLERGSIYSYWPDPCKNIVITGHNSRTSGTMFHQLHYVQNRASELSEYANRLWCINTYGETGYWEVWAMYEEGAFSNPNNSSLVYNTCYPNKMDSMSEQEQQGWIFYQFEKTELGFKPSVTPRDRFMTLVTCGDTHADSERGSRLYFFLRWVGGN